MIKLALLVLAAIVVLVVGLISVILCGVEFLVFGFTWLDVLVFALIIAGIVKLITKMKR